jgi:transposase
VLPYLLLSREDSLSRQHRLRELFNGVRYIVKTGNQWRHMPHDLPPWSAVYQQMQRWLLPECFVQLRRLLEGRLKHGSREYVQVLRLLETFALEEVTAAIEDALQLGTISFDAVKHLLLCRIEHRPPRLDMENYPHLPPTLVRTTQAADYMSLLVGEVSA